MKNEDFESQEDLGWGGKVKNWIQDNIRIIISVLIVVVIAGGIYSYSNRSQDSFSEEEMDLEEEFAMEEGSEGGQEIDNTETTTEADVKEEAKVNPESAETENKTISQETGEAFIETAVAGDSQTTLARKALASYLEKNTDSELTNEHKIYIEDYLRKNVGHSGGVKVGSQISFSKNLIKDSIEKSKTLNENQLENLKKYSARVSEWK